MNKIFKVLAVLTLIFGFAGIGFTGGISSPRYSDENRIYVPIREDNRIIIPYHNSNRDIHIITPSPYFYKNREAPNSSDRYQRNPNRVPAPFPNVPRRDLNNPYYDPNYYRDNKALKQTRDKLRHYLNSHKRKSIDDPEW